MVEGDRQRYKREEEKPVTWIVRAFTPKHFFVKRGRVMISRRRKMILKSSVSN
jgi:hypothetical protein